MHERTVETLISLGIYIVWSESLLSAWTNAKDDLSLFGLQAFAQIYRNYNRNDKNYDIK